MAKIDLDLIQALRNRTGVGMMDCKKALQETDGDIEKAVEILRKKGAAIAEKRSGNETAQGIIHNYIHAGAKMGVMIQINCETDFVAATQDMKNFAQDLCLHIAAFKPKYVRPEEVDQDFINNEKRILIEQLENSGKPAGVITQIIDGKLKKIFSEICLMQQPFVKNDQLTVDDLLKELIAKMGENIKVTRFCRFEIGA